MFGKQFNAALGQLFKNMRANFQIGCDLRAGIAPVGTVHDNKGDDLNQHQQRDKEKQDA